MFSFVRKVVAGPKKTTTFEGEELDLTYITNRIIAMAFPASQLIEKTYRNPIEQVAAYLNQNHDVKYFIFNVSSRFYDHSSFQGRVKDYEWPDHQAPPLTTLIQIGYDIYAYLKGDPERVIAVHCNHGKGRTGTAIITFMLLTRYFNSSLECLKYYNQKRFNNNKYGVDQPCQLRYLRFIEQILLTPKISPKLVCYRLNKVTQRGLDANCFLRIYFTRTQKMIFQKLQLGQLLNEKQKENLLTGDIFIEIMQETWKGLGRIARINYNMYFNGEQMELTFKSADIKLENNHFSDFQLTFHMQYFCLCHLPTYNETVCSCKHVRNIEQMYWNDMISKVKECKSIDPRETILLTQGRIGQSPIKNQIQGSMDISEKQINKQHQNITIIGNNKFKSNQKEKLSAFIQTTMERKINLDIQNEIASESQLQQDKQEQMKPIHIEEFHEENQKIEIKQEGNQEIEESLDKMNIGEQNQRHQSNY